ncbi:hypothetical protein SLEP1_g12628 [Rubroshorea leprosula]|uniref:Uncharacterized protein n=1 Tax=Rubroshorea leprosula TaxID=152421 RepID=A0AAV5IPI7_9ROSI|nr:hypothetical protein SLEP1_g12628 [Rubroshorea leprosula]
MRRVGNTDFCPPLVIPQNFLEYLTRFYSSCLPAATREKKKRGNPAPAFEKPVRKLGFGLLFLFKNKIGALKPSPLLEIPDLLCSFLPHRRLLLIVGDFWAFFRFPLNFPCTAADFSPCQVRFCSWKFWKRNRERGNHRK